MERILIVGTIALIYGAHQIYKNRETWKQTPLWKLFGGDHES